MAGLPEIKIVGTITADPELRYIPSGAAVVSFTVAANDRKFDKDRNEWVDGDATFLRCNLWRQPAENVAESLRKGHRVLVTGQLKQRSFEKDGQKRTTFEVEVDEVGPSLKWATASVSKAGKSGGNGGRSSRSEWSESVNEDPWGSQHGDDKPPF